MTQNQSQQSKDDPKQAPESGDKTGYHQEINDLTEKIG